MLLPVLSMVDVEVQGMRVENSEFVYEISSGTQTTSLIVQRQKLLYLRCSIIIIHLIVETIITLSSPKLASTLCLSGLYNGGLALMPFGEQKDRQ